MRRIILDLLNSTKVNVTIKKSTKHRDYQYVVLNNFYKSKYIKKFENSTLITHWFDIINAIKRHMINYFSHHY